jgi:hypothetical protein
VVANPDRARVLNPAPAHIAQGVLAEQGIESMIRSDNIGGMYPALDAAELLVRSQDLERATAALDTDEA